MKPAPIQESAGFSDLPKAEQIRYLQALWDRIAERPGEISVPESHLALAKERLAEYRRDPSRALPAYLASIEAGERRMEIDFSRKEKETGWQAVLDNFWLKAVPVWFDWLKWVMMMAALMVVNDKSGSWVIRGLVSFSFFAMFSYFAAFFFQIKLKGLPIAWSAKKAFATSLVLSSLLTIAAGWCASHLAAAVALMSN